VCERIVSVGVRVVLALACELFGFLAEASISFFESLAFTVQPGDEPLVLQAHARARGLRRSLKFCCLCFSWCAPPVQFSKLFNDVGTIFACSFEPTNFKLALPNDRVFRMLFLSAHRILHAHANIILFITRSENRMLWLHRFPQVSCEETHL